MTATAHYTSEQLNMFLDGRMAEGDRRRMQDHLSTCTRCRSAFDTLSRIDAALRRLPLAGVGPDFTRSVMDRVLATQRPSFAFRLLEKLPYIFGLLVVLGIMVASFVLTGVFDGSQLEQGRSVATSVAGKAGEVLTGAAGMFTAWLVRYFPFAFGKDSMGVAVFAAAVIAMLAAVDRVVTRKVMQR